MTTTADTEAGLSADQARSMILAVADRVIASEALLCKADRDVGDGDHGLGMTRGFSAVRRQLAEPEVGMDTAESIFVYTGDVLLRSMGGASGVIFALLFRAGAAGSTATSAVSGVAELAGHFTRSMAEISSRGGAGVGDKTMLDALAPAVDSLSDSALRRIDLPTALRHAAEAATRGAEESKRYVARFGKAVSLGRRVIGYPDPGALSTAIIFTAMADWTEDNLPVFHDQADGRTDRPVNSTTPRETS